jgi:hypothetical protein
MRLSFHLSIIDGRIDDCLTTVRSGPGEDPNVLTIEKALWIIQVVNI